MRGIPPVQRIFAIHMFRIIPNFVWVSESFRCLLNKAITDILCQRQCNCTCTRKSSFLPIFKCMWLKYSDIVLQVWWKSSRIQQYRYTTNFFNDPNLSGSCSIRRLINDSITCFFLLYVRNKSSVWSSCKQFWPLSVSTQTLEVPELLEVNIRKYCLSGRRIRRTARTFPNSSSSIMGYTNLL